MVSQPFYTLCSGEEKTYSHPVNNVKNLNIVRQVGENSILKCKELYFMARYLHGKLRLNSVFLLLFLVSAFGSFSAYAQVQHPITGTQTTNVGAPGIGYTDDDAGAGANYVDSIPCSPAPCTSAGARNSTQRFVQAGSVGPQGQIVVGFNTYTVANGDSLTPAGFINPNPPATATVTNGAIYVGPSLDFQFRTTFDNNDGAGWSADVGVYDVDVIFDKNSLTTGESPARPIFCATQTDDFTLRLNYGRTTNNFRGYDSVIVNIPSYPGGAIRNIYTAGAGNTTGANQNVAVNGLTFPDEGVYAVDVYVYAFGVEMNVTSSSIVVMDDIDFADVTFDAVNGEFICEGETETYQASANVPNNYTGDAAPFSKFGIARTYWAVNNVEVVSSRINYSPSVKTTPVTSFNIPTNLPEGMHNVCFTAEFDINCGGGVVAYDTCFTVNIINPDAGQDVTFALCETASPEDLNTRLTATADADGTWSMSVGSTDDLIGGPVQCFDPATGILDVDCAVANYGADKTYCFQYSSSGYGSCPDDIADICVIIDRLPNPGGPLPGNGSSPATAIELCASSGLIDLCSVDFFGALSTPDPGGTFDVDGNGPVGIGPACFWSPRDPGVVPGVFPIEYEVGEPTSACPAQSSEIWIDLREEPEADVDVVLEMCTSDPDLDLNTLRGSSTPDETTSTARVSWEICSMSTANRNEGVFTGGGPNNPINIIRPRRAVESDTIEMCYVINNGALCENDTLRVTIYLQLEPEAGEDVTGKEYCSNQVIDIDVEAPSVIPRDTKGEWHDGSYVPVVSTTLDLDVLGAGSFCYYYIVPATAPSCEPDTAEFCFTVDEFRSAGGPFDTAYVCETATGVAPFSFISNSPDIGGTFTFSPFTTPFTGNDEDALFDPQGQCENAFDLVYTQNANGACPVQRSRLHLQVTCVPNVGDDKTANDAICTDTAAVGNPWDSYDLTQHIGANDNGITDGSLNFMQWQFISADAGNPDMNGALDITAGTSADGILNANLAGAGTYTIYYIVFNPKVGCAADTLTITLLINEPGNAGDDGVIAVCNDIDGGVLLEPFLSPGADPASATNTTFNLGTTCGDILSATGAAAEWTHEDCPSAVDSLFYIVEVEFCPSDSAQFYTLQSLSPRAGLQKADTLTACSDQQGLDLFDGLLDNPPYDRGGMGTWTVKRSSLTPLVGGGSDGDDLETIINTNILKRDPITEENSLIDVDTLVQVIKAIQRRASGSSDFLCTPNQLSELTFTYTARDTNDFTPYGVASPICPEDSEDVLLIIGRKYPEPEAIISGQRELICMNTVNLDLNQRMKVREYTNPDVDTLCGWRGRFPYPFDELLFGDTYEWEGRRIGGDDVDPSDIDNGILDITNLEPGDYDFTVTIKSKICEDEVSAILRVTLVEQPVVETPQTFDICQNDFPLNLEEKLTSATERGGIFTMTIAGQTFFGNAAERDFQSPPPGGPAATRPILIQPYDAKDKVDQTITDAFTYRVNSDEDPVNCFAVADITVNWKQGPNAGIDFGVEVCGDSLLIPLRNVVDNRNTSGDKAIFSVVGEDGVTAKFRERPSAGHLVNDTDFPNTGFQADNIDELIFVDYIVSKPGCSNDTAVIQVQERVQLTAGVNVKDTICSNVGVHDLAATYLDAMGANLSGKFYRSLANGTRIGVSEIISITPGSTQYPGGNLYHFVYRIEASQSCKADSAVVSIFIEETPNAGVDNSITFCETRGGLVDLLHPDTLSLFLPGAQPGGTIIASSGPINATNFIGDRYFDLDEVSEGTYVFEYILPATTQCPEDRAKLTFIILPEFNPGDGADANGNYTVSVCNSVATYDLFNAVMPGATVGGTFYNSAGGPSSQLIRPRDLAPGAYTYEYRINANNSTLPACSYGVVQITVNIQPKPRAGRDSTLVVCENGGIIDMFRLVSPGAQATGRFEMVGPTTAGLVGSNFNLNLARPVGQTFYYVDYIVESPACGDINNDTAHYRLKVDQLANAGGDQFFRICDEVESVDLADTLITVPGVAGGNYFALDGIVRNTGRLFGTEFTTTGLAAGTYRFRYTKSSVEGVCPIDTAIISIEIVKYPKDTTVYRCVSEEFVPIYPTFEVPQGKGLSFNTLSSTGNGFLDTPTQFNTENETGTYNFNLVHVGYFMDEVCVDNYKLVISDTLAATVNAECDDDGKSYAFNIEVTGGDPTTYRILNQFQADVTNTDFTRVGNVFTYSQVNVPAGESRRYTIEDDLNCGGEISVVAFADCKDFDDDDKDDVEDIDADNDGITNLNESGGFDLFGDSNANGVVDYADADFCAAAGGDMNANGACKLWDKDGDGIVNALDLDSDNDGIVDIYEAFNNPLTFDPTMTGQTDVVNPATGMNDLAFSAQATILDTDGDGTPDFLDTDSDDDGILDAVERRQDTYGAEDFDGDSEDNFRDLDSDNDGIADKYEGRTDTDGDGNENFVDMDSDNDGLPDAVEAAPMGEDGEPYNTVAGTAPDFINVDADNDGLYDALEGLTYYAYTQVGGVNIATGQVNNFVDFGDNNGWTDQLFNLNVGHPDTLVNTEVHGGFGYPIKDTIPDFRDFDSDNDGIRDSIEALPGYRGGDFYNMDGDFAPIRTASGVYLYGPLYNFRDLDSDNDGIPDKYEGSEAGAINDVNLKVKLGANYRRPFVNVDADYDGIPDMWEFYEEDKARALEGAVLDGMMDINGSFSDANGNGWDEEQEVVFTIAEAINTDADNGGEPDLVPDFLDFDSDGDGIYDFIEIHQNGFITDATYGTTIIYRQTGINTDGEEDGPDFRDLDSDDDGLLDEVEKGPNGKAPSDSDGDSNPDFRDLDSDDDGLTDRTERDEDCDGDGLLDYVDPIDEGCTVMAPIPEGFSPNGDGVNDRFVIEFIEDYPQNKLQVFNRWGGKVYEKEGYDNTWDGNNPDGMGSGELPAGTYYYLLDLGVDQDPIKGYVYINR